MEHPNENPASMLSPWPVQRPRNWADRVNRAQPAKVEARVQLSIRRGRPLGGDAWQKRIARQLGLTSTFRDRGRPRKRKAAAK